MASGGARLGSGPPPNPQSRRQTGRQAASWTDLPAGGHDGEIPDWPLSGPTSRERAVWRKLWRTPQAHAWARGCWPADVALYVRYLMLAELGDMKAAAEARQWSDRLGLSPAAMLRNRWRIATAEPEPKPAASPTKRRRFVVVPDESSRSNQ